MSPHVHILVAVYLNMADVILIINIVKAFPFSIWFFKPSSLVVEDKKIAILGNKWYQDKFGIIRCRIFWRITYQKSSAIPFGEKSYGRLKFHANNCILEQMS